jgi:adenylate kinase family enzyme
VRRVSVVGNSGSGKSTTGRQLAAALSVPYVEVDALNHQANWTLLEPAELLNQVDLATTGEGWVVDGNYSNVLDLVWERADTVVWLDLPRRLVMRQVIGRSAKRVLTHQELWNGNRERWRSLLHPKPEESIIRWAWTRHAIYAERYAQRTTDPRWAELTVVRLRSRADVNRFVTTIP